VKHFIRKSGSVFLDTDLYKAVPSETFQAPPMEIKGKRWNPTHGEIQQAVWKEVTTGMGPGVSDAAKKDFYDRVMRGVYVESSGKQYKRPGKILTSEAGAQGIGQIMPKTAQALGVSPEKSWKEGIKGKVKYYKQHYDFGLRHGMKSDDALDYASMSYFSGGADRAKNVSELARLQKKNPQANLFMVQQKKLKGAPSQVAKFANPKTGKLSPNWRSQFSAAAKDSPRREDGSKSFIGALEGYAQAAKSGKRFPKNAAPLRVPEEQASRYGLSHGVQMSEGKPVASVPVHQSRPMASRPSPSVASQKPGLFNRLRSRVEGLRSGNRAVSASNPSVTKSISFESELFVEE